MSIGEAKKKALLMLKEDKHIRYVWFCNSKEKGYTIVPNYSKNDKCPNNAYYYMGRSGLCKYIGK